MQRLTRVCWDAVAWHPATNIPAMKHTAVSFQQYFSSIQAATFCCLKRYTINTENDVYLSQRSVDKAMDPNSDKLR